MAFVFAALATLAGSVDKKATTYSLSRTKRHRDHKRWVLRSLRICTGNVKRSREAILQRKLRFNPVLRQDSYDLSKIRFPVSGGISATKPHPRRGIRLNNDSQVGAPLHGEQGYGRGALGAKKAQRDTRRGNFIARPKREINVSRLGRKCRVWEIFKYLGSHASRLGPRGQCSVESRSTTSGSGTA